MSQSRKRKATQQHVNSLNSNYVPLVSNLAPFDIVIPEVDRDELLKKGIIDQNDNFIRRRMVKYPPNELNIILQEGRCIDAGFDLLQARGHQKFYPQQTSMSCRILSEFRNNEKVYCLIVAETQSGKTGVMCCLIRDIVRDIHTPIPMENIIILAAISDNTWAEQTKEDLPQCLHDQVIHRSNLEKLKSKILDNNGKLKKNMLIIIDECHVASKGDQTIADFFKEHRLDNHDVLCAHDIKIAEFTATPDGILLDIGSWNENSQRRAKRLDMTSGPTYVGASQLLAQGRLRQQKDLLCAKYNKSTESWNIDYGTAANHCDELFRDINKFKQPMYHIIRVHTQLGDGHQTAQNITQKHLELAASRANIQVKFKYFHSKSKDKAFQSKAKSRDIDNLLQDKPVYHTFILVKELLRCAKNIKHKEYLGILYGRKAKKDNDSAIIQAEVGRGSGYNGNAVMKVYTNISSVKRYQRYVTEPSSTIWNSLTTTRKGRGKRRKTVSKGTRVARKADSEPSLEVTHGAVAFSSWDELISFFEEHKLLISKPNASGPSKQNRKLVDGFFYAPNLVIRGTERIETIETVLKYRNFGIDDHTTYRVWAAYGDVTNADTLTWVLCWEYKTTEDRLFFQKYLK